METQTQHRCLKLNIKFFVQQAERCSATLRGIRSLRVWERPTCTDSLTTVLKEDEGLANILPQFPSNGHVSSDDVFLCHEVQLGNGGERPGNRRSAWFPTASVPSERNTNYTGLFHVKSHLADGDLAEEEKETSPIETQDETAELPGQEEMCKLLPNEEKDQSGHQDERGLKGQTDETIEEAVEKRKDKSVRRRWLNWLDQVIHNLYRKKIAETYRREQEEGHQFYPSTFYFIRPMTQADRERQKRQTWLERDHQRQSIRKVLDSYWEEKHKKKEALRIKEEDRYEKWAAEHCASVSTSAPDKPRKRMSRWEKRLLRAKASFFH